MMSALFTAQPTPRLIGFLQESSDSLLNRSIDRDGVEVISTSIATRPNGSLGFSVTGNEEDGVVFVSAIAPDGAVARDGRILVGDRILSINGTKVSGMRQAEVTALLSPGGHKELYLVVERSKHAANGLKSPPTSSTPVPIPTAAGPSTSGGYVASLPYGDTTLDGTEEVNTRVLLDLLDQQYTSTQCATRSKEANFTHRPINYRKWSLCATTGMRSVCPLLVVSITAAIRSASISRGSSSRKYHPTPQPRSLGG